MSEEDLRQAVLEALPPKGWRERIGLRITKGYTASGLDRLSDGARGSIWGDAANEVVAWRQAVHRVTSLLFSLGQRGQVERRKVDLEVSLPDKGIRNVRWTST